MRCLLATLLKLQLTPQHPPYFLPCFILSLPIFKLKRISMPPIALKVEIWVGIGTP